MEIVLEFLPRWNITICEIGGGHDKRHVTENSCHFSIACTGIFCFPS